MALSCQGRTEAAPRLPHHSPHLSPTPFALLRRGRGRSASLLPIQTTHQKWVICFVIPLCTSDFLGTSLAWFRGEGQLQQPPPSQPLIHRWEGHGPQQGLMWLCHLFLNPEGVSGPRHPWFPLQCQVFRASVLPDLVPIAHPEQSESMQHPAALINKQKGQSIP